jgi:hypothetical protein
MVDVGLGGNGHRWKATIPSCPNPDLQFALINQPRLWISREADIAFDSGFAGLEAVGDDAGEDVDEGIDG